MFNHALYSLSHFKLNTFTLNLAGPFTDYFGAHFSPIIFLYIPFYYIFGSYTLLVIQIVAILLGGIGIYKIAKHRNGGNFIPLIAILHFLGIWGIYSALSFDFHDNVIGAMLVPWLYYFYVSENRRWTLILFFLILFSRENMSLWLCFIFLGMLIQQRRFDIRKLLKFELPLMAFSAFYFVLIIGVVMPAIVNDKDVTQLVRYTSFGTSVSEIIINMISNPQKVFTLLFESDSSEKILLGIKGELHFMVLVSGGIALLYRPQFLLMLVPIYLQKMLTNDYVLWGINGHYSIEFAPIISIAMIESLNNIKKVQWKYLAYLPVLYLTFHYTEGKLERRNSLWYNRINSDFLIPHHYRTELDIEGVHQMLELVPKEAALSTSTSLAPHLANRDKIYHFPTIEDAEYIVLFKTHGDYYPLSKEEYEAKIESFKKSEKYQILHEKHGVLIIKIL